MKLITAVDNLKVSLDRLAAELHKRRGSEAQLYRPPNGQTLMKLLSASDYQELRFIIDPHKQSFYVWDAGEADHFDTAESLGIDPYDGNFIGGEIKGDSPTVLYNVYGDGPNKNLDPKQSKGFTRAMSGLPGVDIQRGRMNLDNNDDEGPYEDDPELEALTRKIEEEQRLLMQKYHQT